jgi:hypothetical protein
MSARRRRGGAAEQGLPIDYFFHSLAAAQRERGSSVGCPLKKCYWHEFCPSMRHNAIGQDQRKPLGPKRAGMFTT